MGLESFEDGPIDNNVGSKYNSAEYSPDESVREAVVEYAKKHPEQKYLKSRWLAEALDYPQTEITIALRVMKNFDEWSAQSAVFVNPYLE